MKALHGALLFVAGGALGFAVAPRDDPSAVETLRRERDAAKTRADRAEADLATAREAKPRRHDATELPKGAVPADSREPFEDPKKAAPEPAKPDAPSPEAKTKRLNEIRGSLAAIFENHEGEKALAALKELAALGPDARDDAMKLAMDIFKDVNGPGALRLPQFTFYTGLGDPAVRELMTWSLENAASSPAGFRNLSAWSLPWTLPPKDVVARFDAALAHEPDRGVQAAIVSNLGSMNTPEAESVLARIFADSNRDAQLRADSVLALASTKDEAVIRAIENAAQADPSPQVSAAAKATLVVRDPPATGLLVIRMAPDGNAEAAGIRPGDVVTAYNGRGIQSNDDLIRERDAAAGTGLETVPVVVNRGGREQTIQVKPGRLGMSDVRAVTKK